MSQPKPTDGSDSVGYCDCCGKWNNDLVGHPTYSFFSCPRCDDRLQFHKDIVKVDHTRTEMKCKCCGQYSSAQYCWYCTERIAGRDPIILENIRLGKELVQAQNMAKVCLDMHQALGVKWGDDPYGVIRELRDRPSWEE